VALRAHPTFPSATGEDQSFKGIPEAKTSPLVDTGDEDTEDEDQSADEND
jgi:hypothetical protein